jgi:hypothetical protein
LTVRLSDVMRRLAAAHLLVQRLQASLMTAAACVPVISSVRGEVHRSTAMKRLQLSPVRALPLLLWSGTLRRPSRKCW